MQGRSYAVAYFLCSSGESFPFTLTICQVTEDTKPTVEGLIEWPTLDKSITKFLGMVSHGSSGQTEFKFREYEAIRGEDSVELPGNYKGVLMRKILSGTVQSKENKATFSLEFKGVRSPKEGIN